jgi:hypothetical protein
MKKIASHLISEWGHAPAMRSYLCPLFITPI